jgi:hypothetical protein
VMRVIQGGSPPFFAPFVHFAYRHTENGRTMDLIRAEGQLNALIERRALKASGEQRTIEDLWEESVRRVREQTRRENRAAWYAHHEHMRELHESLAREHEAKASALLDGGRG